MLEVMQATDLDELFFLPLSQQAFEEYEVLQLQLQNLQYDADAKDCWLPTWGDVYT